MVDDPLDLLFRETAQTDRDPAFVARVMRQTRRQPRRRARPAGVMAHVARAFLMGGAALVAALAVQVVGTAAAAALSVPAVTYSLLVIAVMVGGSLVLGRWRPMA